MAGTQYMVIDFTPDGGAEAMHRENILDLGFLGKQEITRASDIRFDSEKQTWGIWPSVDCLPEGEGFCSPDGFVPPPKYADGFTSYETARQVEIAWFERCRLRDWVPMSDDGQVCLQAIVMAMVVSAGY